jgi:hypothetical protein
MGRFSIRIRQDPSGESLPVMYGLLNRAHAMLATGEVNGGPKFFRAILPGSKPHSGRAVSWRGCLKEIIMKSILLLAALVVGLIGTAGCAHPQGGTSDHSYSNSGHNNSASPYDPYRQPNNLRFN